MNLSFHIAFTCQTVAYRLCRTLYFFIRKCVARKYYLCIFLLLCPIFMQHLYLKRIAQCRINGLKCTFIYIFRHSQTILLQKSPIFICKIRKLSDSSHFLLRAQPLRPRIKLYFYVIKCFYIF